MKARFGVGTHSWAGILRRALPWLVVGALGAVEGLYGRTQYLGDWISYLNVSRAASAFDWRSVFDSMWSPGYPLLVALVRGIFPATADGEWYAITLLNWLIFLMAYASWRLLIRRGIELYKPTEVALSHHPFVEFTTGCIFLSCALGLDQVSSVCPDLLITALFVLTAAQILSLLVRPGAGTAVTLGLVLGAGCWMKGVFLAFSMIFLLTMVLACYRKRMPWKMVSIAAATFLLLYLPYAAGLSWSYGKFTVGTTGSLNYEFHVDHLPHWTNWQGTPSPAGVPMHLTTQLAQGLPIFSFGSPFRTTYPPYNNLAYWYQGTHPYYRWNLEMAAVGRSLYFLAVIVRANPFLYLLALAWCTVMLKRDWRRSMMANMIRFWPIVLPCYLGVFSYLLVHVEDRYMSPFCMIFGLVPLLPLLDSALVSRRKLAVLLVLVYGLGTALEMKATAGNAFVAAVHRRDFHEDSQWRIAGALPTFGIRSDDAVAVIHGTEASFRCHWAYVARVRIVAEFGGLPWTLEPWDRTRFDGHAAEPADEDYGRIFWEKLTPQQRRMVINLFRSTGARAIVSLTRPTSAPETGWQPIPGTQAMIYRFDPQ